MQVNLSVALLGVLWALAGGQEYRQVHIFVNEQKTWSEAQDYCKRKYTDLSIHGDEFEYKKLPEQVKGNDSIWIGLHFVENSWKWTDGMGLSFKKWNTDQPALSNEKPCAWIRQGNWSTDECEKRHTFICFKWTRQLILVRENKTWEDALIHCRSHYIDLTSIVGQNKLQLAKEVSHEANTPQVWTSLRFLAGEWLWVDRTPKQGVTYQGNSVPQCPSQSFNCGAFGSKSYNLTNKDCQEKLNFICHKTIRGRG